MGDSCYMSIRIRAADLPLFEALGFRKGDDCGEGKCYAIDEERDYADVESLPRGVPYVGDHASGHSYPAGVFACDGISFAACDSDHDTAYPVARVDANGIMAGDLSACRLYWLVVASADKALCATATGGAP